LTYAIEVQDLVKTYPKPRNFFEIFSKKNGEEILALDEVNLKVKNGELFGVLGPNGAGKTTLTKILCTLIIPTKGEVRINGYDALNNGGEVRSLIGLVSSDERSFYWKLSGRQNLLFFALLHDFKKGQAKKRVEEVLDEVGLKNNADNRFETYSSGMKQQMSIARGLLHKPEILFMDEPTRSLDPNAARETRDFISNTVREGKTVFLATHNLHEAELLCDRVAILDKGKVRGVGSVKDFEKTFKQGEKITVEIKDFDNKKISSLRKLSSVKVYDEIKVSEKFYRLKILTHEDSVSEIIENIIKLGGKINSIKTENTRLEEIFKRLTIGGEKID
jgi:ABC-2 type transport system ATP-binding protein